MTRGGGDLGKPHRRAAIGLGLAALAAPVHGCVGDSGGPRLDAVAPIAASRNATVMLTGVRLCGPMADCATAAGEVQLGLDPPVVRAVVVGYTDTVASIVVPAAVALGPTQLVVTVDDRVSNALAFTVLP